jgi:hypothetical protein
MSKNVIINGTIKFYKKEIRSVVLKFCLRTIGRKDSHDEDDRGMSATFLCKHVIKYIRKKYVLPLDADGGLSPSTNGVHIQSRKEVPNQSRKLCFT